MAGYERAAWHCGRKGSFGLHRGCPELGEHPDGHRDTGVNAKDSRGGCSEWVQPSAFHVRPQRRDSCSFEGQPIDIAPELWIDPVTVLLQPNIVSQELFMSALVKVALKVPALKVWFTSKRYYL